MNRDQFAGKWKQFHGQLQEQWGTLTDDQADRDAGRRDQLAGRIQEQHGNSKQREARELRDFRDKNRDWYLSD